MAAESEDLQSGSDPEFEGRWWRIERIAWIVSAVILLAGVFGAFGRGLLARGRVQFQNGEVEYERVVRFRTSSVIRVKLTGPAPHRIALSNELTDALALQRVLPTPSDSALSPFGTEMQFDDNASVVQLYFDVGKVGSIRGEIAIDGEAPQSLNAFGVP